MGGIICCCWRMFCCECALFEKKDDWKIDDECRPGERGAGYLYKRAKSSAIWSKRYFVIKGDKLTYYLERDRLTVKGEIVLAGASAVISTTRPDTKKKFYFNITHPQCGVRELCAKTRARRLQWVERINELSNQITGRTAYGKLLKQGGLSKNIWQERWCICAGASLDYFESATDNQSKGTINIINAKVQPIQVKDRHCFEITAAVAGKKGHKKYVFAAENQYERDQWVEQLKKNSTLQIAILNGEEENPLHAAKVNNGDDDEEGGSAANFEEDNGRNMSQSVRSSVVPIEMSGYLMKKSPAMMKGWQKRYFKTLENGDIAYYKSEEDANSSKESKGVIKLSDIQQDGVDLNENSGEITLKTEGKKVYLKAANGEEAADWARNIMNWLTANKE